MPVKELGLPRAEMVTGGVKLTLYRRELGVPVAYSFTVPPGTASDFAMSVLLVIQEWEALHAEAARR